MRTAVRTAIAFLPIYPRPVQHVDVCQSDHSLPHVFRYVSMFVDNPVVCVASHLALWDVFGGRRKYAERLFGVGTLHRILFVPSGFARFESVQGATHCISHLVLQHRCVFRASWHVSIDHRDGHVGFALALHVSWISIFAYVFVRTLRRVAWIAPARCTLVRRAVPPARGSASPRFDQSTTKARPRNGMVSIDPHVTSSLTRPNRRMKLTRR